MEFFGENELLLLGHLDQNVLLENRLHLMDSLGLDLLVLLREGAPAGLGNLKVQDGGKHDQEREKDVRKHVLYRDGLTQLLPQNILHLEEVLDADFVDPTWP